MQFIANTLSRLMLCMADGGYGAADAMPERHRRRRRSSGQRARPGQLVVVVLVVMAAAWVILSAVNGIVGRRPIFQDEEVADRQLFQFLFPSQYREMRQEKWEEREDKLEQRP